LGLIDRFGTLEDGALDLSRHRIELVLGEAEMSHLDPREELSGGMAIATHQVEPERALPEPIARQAEVVCIEVKPGCALSVERISHLRRDYPELPVVAAVRHPDVALVRALLRQGVKDVVELPISLRQLGEAVRDLLAHRHDAPRTSARRGSLISVIKSIGGVGATNVVVQLATALVEGEAGRKACLFDLDIQFGNAATYLGVTQGSSLNELLEGGNRVDKDFLDALTTSLPSGLKFVSAPQEIGPIEAINADQLTHVLGVARGQFDYVLADMPANWANWTLSVVAQSDIIILVVNLTIASLRQGKRQLDLLRSQGIAPARIAVVANRVEQKLFKPISLDDAAKALGHPVSHFVHNDYALMSAANNQGLVVSALNRKSKVARDFARIAESLVEQVGVKG
jgi:pilus assembly protein CpaE